MKELMNTINIMDDIVQVAQYSTVLIVEEQVESFSLVYPDTVESYYSNRVQTIYCEILPPSRLQLLL